MIPELPQESTLVFVCGPVASGKTYLAKEWSRMMERACVFDPTTEWGEQDGFEVFQLWTRERGPRVFAGRMAELEKSGEPYRVAVWPGNIETGFDWTTKAIWQMTQPRWYIIEEINQVMSAQSQEEMMSTINRFARKRLLGVMGLSQRLSDVHKNFTSACRESVLFHTTEPRDLDAIEERWGPEARDHVESLRPLIYDDATETATQLPQCLVIKRGQGMEVFDLGAQTHATGTLEEAGPEPEENPDSPQ